MEQHPIPQNISSYQFRLVGDMTLKQFFQVAGGLLVAFIFYSLPVIGIIKWPLVIISAALGAGLAFLPIEERPLERWIFAFFRAIYSPTEFLWKKTVTPVKFFQDEAVDTVTNLSDKLTNTPPNNLDVKEQGFMSRLSALFTPVKKTATTAVMPMTTPIVAPITSTPLVRPTPSTAVDTTPPPINVMTLINNNPSPTPETLPTVDTTPLKPSLQIPLTAPIRIVQPGAPHLVVEEQTPQVPITTQQVTPIIAGNEMVSTKQAVFSVDAAPPSPPVANNVVVGQVVDQDKKMLEGAIMEIKDSSGRPIRALRSNKLGHFVTVTPLDNGNYSIITEKDGFEFSPVGFEATGATIAPILITGKKLPVVEDLMADRPIVETYTPDLSSNVQ